MTPAPIQTQSLCSRTPCQASHAPPISASAASDEECDRLQNEHGREPTARGPRTGRVMPACRSSPHHQRSPAGGGGGGTTTSPPPRRARPATAGSQLTGDGPSRPRTLRRPRAAAATHDRRRRQQHPVRRARSVAAGGCGQKRSSSVGFFGDVGERDRAAGVARARDQVLTAGGDGGRGVPAMTSRSAILVSTSASFCSARAVRPRIHPPVMVPPRIEQVADLLQREAEPLRRLDHAQYGHRVRPVQPMTAQAAVRLLDQPAPLVVPQRLQVHPPPRRPPHRCADRSPSYRRHPGRSPNGQRIQHLHLRGRRRPTSASSPGRCPPRRPPSRAFRSRR